MTEIESGRNYQIALYELAKENNIVVCLPTGSGKTHIALKLAKYFLPTAIPNKKKIVFMANTVPLVHQQAKYFREHLFAVFYSHGINNRNVQELIGDMNTDIWDKHKWDATIGSAHVFVMTSQVLLDALSHSYITFKQMSLLVLDECHHADKDHPMNKIMEKYGAIMDKNSEKKENYELPRVLGLTATIIKGGGAKSEKISDEVRDIERRLRCSAVTYHNYDEVLQHSTKAHVHLKQYSNEVGPSPQIDYTDIFQCLDEAIENIEAYSKIVEKPPEAAKSVHHPSLRFTGQIFNKNKSYIKEYTDALKDVRKIFEYTEGLGVYCGRMAAYIKISYLLTIITTSEILKLLQSGAVTALIRVIKYSDELMAGKTKSEQVQQFVSNKILLLYDILLKWKVDNVEGEELCGIVFCTERLTAQLLTWLFADAKECLGERFQFITPAFVVGSSKRCKEVEQQRTTTSKQVEVIRQFHKKIVNLIFATNVLEEGLNVPTCNVIIRFDPINTYPSYVQSMGRARKRGALFCVMTSEANFTRNQNLIAKFQSFNTNLASHLQNQHREFGSKDEKKNNHVEEKDDGKSEYDYLAVDPSDPDSPKVTLADAVQLVHRYCNLLPSDDLVTTSDPFSWWDIARDPVTNLDLGFKAFVQMPVKSIVKGVTEGGIKDSKNDAKRAAFLEVCKKLYKKGAFDQKLFPLPRGCAATLRWPL